MKKLLIPILSLACLIAPMSASAQDSGYTYCYAFSPGQSSFFSGIFPLSKHSASTASAFGDFVRVTYSVNTNAALNSGCINFKDKSDADQHLYADAIRTRTNTKTTMTGWNP